MNAMDTTAITSREDTDTYFATTLLIGGVDLSCEIEMIDSTTRRK